MVSKKNGWIKWGALYYWIQITKSGIYIRRKALQSKRSWRTGIWKRIIFPRSYSIRIKSTLITPSRMSFYPIYKVKKRGKSIALCFTPWKPLNVSTIFILKNGLSYADTSMGLSLSRLKLPLGNMKQNKIMVLKSLLWIRVIVINRSCKRVLSKYLGLCSPFFTEPPNHASLLMIAAVPLLPLFIYYINFPNYKITRNYITTKHYFGNIDKFTDKA